MNDLTSVRFPLVEQVCCFSFFLLVPRMCFLQPKLGNLANVLDDFARSFWKGF